MKNAAEHSSKYNFNMQRFCIVFYFYTFLWTQVCEATWRSEVSVGGGGEVRLTLPVGAECGGEMRLTLPGILL